MFEINYVNVLPPVLDDSQIYVKKEIGYSSASTFLVEKTMKFLKSASTFF